MTKILYYGICNIMLRIQSRFLIGLTYLALTFFCPPATVAD